MKGLMDEKKEGSKDERMDGGERKKGWKEDGRINEWINTGVRRKLDYVYRLNWAEPWAELGWTRLNWAEPWAELGWIMGWTGPNLAELG